MSTFNTSFEKSRNREFVILYWKNWRKQLILKKSYRFTDKFHICNYVYGVVNEVCMVKPVTMHGLTCIGTELWLGYDTSRTRSMDMRFTAYRS